MKQTIRQLIVFLGVGLLNTGTTLAVIWGLMYSLHLAPLIANFLGYALGLTVSFTLNRRLTFKDQGNVQRAGARFLGAAGIAYGLNVCAILLAEQRLGVNVYLSQVLGNIAYTGSFFILCRWIVFKKASRPAQIAKAVQELRGPFAGPNRETVLVVCKALFISAIVLWLVDTVGFNPLDDHQFARTILQGLPFGAYYNQGLGRFYPLVAQEYVLISKVLGHESQLFYRVGILKVAVLGWILSLAISSTGLRGFQAFILWLLGLVSLGVAGTLFRLHAGDLNAMMLLLGYLTLTAASPKAEASSRSKLWAGCLLAVLASFYKESIAVLLLIFSGTELLRLHLQNRWQEAPHRLLIFLYALGFLMLYKVWAGHPTDANYALTHHTDRLTVILRFLENDPSMFLLTIPALGFRILKNRQNWLAYNAFDAMLLAGLGYLALFVTLGMFNQYYLLPGEAFALVGLAGTLAHAPQNSRFFKTLPLIALLMVLENTPAVFSEVTFQKQVVMNHGRFLNFMAPWSNAHCGDSQPRCTLMLEGLTADHLEIAESLESFMALIAPNRIQVAKETLGITPESRGKARRDATDGAHPGDLVLINPYRVGAAFQDQPSLDPVFRSGDLRAPPRWPLHTWVARCGFSSTEACRIHVDQDSRDSGYRLFKKRRGTLPSKAGLPLQDPTYAIHGAEINSVLHPESPIRVALQIENTGRETWLPDAPGVNPNPVHLAYRWVDPEGGVVQEGRRTALPEAVLPGESYNTVLMIEPPREPGLYRLEITPVQEAIRWFPATFTRDILIR